jgi:hypothetical protein
MAGLRALLDLTLCLEIFTLCGLASSAAAPRPEYVYAQPPPQSAPTYIVLEQPAAARVGASAAARFEPTRAPRGMRGMTL